MADSLSFELICEIAECLDGDAKSLTNGILVCHRWKAAFERVLYREIYLVDGREPDVISRTPTAFRDLVESPAFKGRRALIREIHMLVAVQLYQSDQEAEEAQLNAAEATLSAILQRCNGVHGVRATVSTCYYDLKPDVLPFLYDQWAQTPRNSRLSNMPVLNLSNRGSPANHYDQLSDRVLIHIASSCRSLYNLTLRLSRIGTSNVMDLSRQRLRRQVIADGFNALSPTVCTLILDTQTANDFSFVDIKSSANDDFSKVLWNVSTRLERLEMTNTALPLDFWFPESETRKDNASPHWPDLCAIYSYRDPAFRFIHNVILPLLPANSREAFDLMDTFFISLGHAAQRMPCLATISYGMGMIHPTEFFWTHEDHGRNDVEAEAHWWFPCNYIPSEKVADVWGFRLEDLVTEPGHVHKYVIGFPTWPPAPRS